MALLILLVYSFTQVFWIVSDLDRFIRILLNIALK